MERTLQQSAEKDVREREHPSEGTPGDVVGSKGENVDLPASKSSGSGSMGSRKSPKSLRFAGDFSGKITIASKRLGVKDKSEKRGHGTYTLASVGADYFMVKVFKDPNDNKVLADAITREIAVTNKLHKEDPNSLFPNVQSEAKVGKDQVLVLNVLYGNIFRRCKGPASIEAIRIIMYQLCSAIMALHGMRICHLNIRCESIFCARPQGYLIKLGNFSWADYPDRPELETHCAAEKEARAPEAILDYEAPLEGQDVFAAATAMLKLYFNGDPYSAGKVHGRTNHDLLALRALKKWHGVDLPVSVIKKSKKQSEFYAVAEEDNVQLQPLSVTIRDLEPRLVRAANADEFKLGRDIKKCETELLALCKSMMAYLSKDRATVSRIMEDEFMDPGMLAEGGIEHYRKTFAVRSETASSVETTASESSKSIAVSEAGCCSRCRIL